MAKSSVLLLLGSLLVLLVAAEATNANDAMTVGEKKSAGENDYKRIDVDDPKIQELVKLVVAIHNWQVGSQLQLVGVSCGRSETVLGGTNYNFCLSAEDDNGWGMYTALLFVDAHTKNIFIKSFYPDIDCCFPYPIA